MRPYVLSVAGHDPSGGAGLNADLKTFESLGIQGLSVCTAITFQTEDHFEDLIWLSKKKIRKQLQPLLERYPIEFVKIGIIEDVSTLKWLVKYLRAYNEDIFILWDPVVRTSTGFKLQKKSSFSELRAVMEDLNVVTPNWEEMDWLSGKRDTIEGAKHVSKHCAVYLKGGHHETEKGVDYLWVNKEANILMPKNLSFFAKHGSGCVFSAALISYCARKQSLLDACLSAKSYIEQYLNSTDHLLGIHYFQT